MSGQAERTADLALRASRQRRQLDRLAALLAAAEDGHRPPHGYGGVDTPVTVTVAQVREALTLPAANEPE